MTAGDHVNVAEELTRLAGTLTSSLQGLGVDLGAVPGEVDAGVSTGVVTQALAVFYDSVARMVADTEYQAGQVAGTGGEYMRSDDQAAAELPPLPLPPDGRPGGH